MKHEKFEFRHLSQENVGFAGSIEIAIKEEFCENNEPLFEINYTDTTKKQSIDSIYFHTIHFAVALFVDKQKHICRNKKIEIIIHDILIMPIDTTPIIILYVVYNALLKAYGLSDNLIIFDTYSGTFNFRKK
jgi:hypothetical protein